MKDTKIAEEILDNNVQFKVATGAENLPLIKVAIIKAMQEYAEQYHQSKMKEELMKYDEWYYSQGTYDIVGRSDEEIIDHYLKDRKQ